MKLHYDDDRFQEESHPTFRPGRSGHRRSRSMRGFILLMTLVLTSGCAGLLSTVIEKPKVSLERVELVNPTLTQSTMLFILKVENPNSKALKIDEVSYRVFLENELFAEAKREKGVN